MIALAAPSPTAPVPERPAPLARELLQTTEQLEGHIDEWRAAGSERPPREVALLALFQQRLYMKATSDERLSDAVVRRLPPAQRTQVTDILAARRALVRLTPPTKRPLRSFKTGPPAPPQKLLAWYRAAQRRFGVPWHVLAAVNFVESAFGKLRSASSAGAQGPMQFLPATWRAYGLGGNVHRPRDAILGAANYLRANGAPRDLQRALYRYNPSPLYVDAVLRLARVIRSDRRSFYAFYSWQVYVRTSQGPRRVTGFWLR